MQSGLIFPTLILLTILYTCNGALLCSLNKATTFNCNETLAVVRAKAACITVGVETYCNGYQQFGVNKNPIFRKWTNNTPTWCRTDYETTNDDGTGHGLLFNNVTNELWGFFSSTGSQLNANNTDFSKVANGTWLKSYSDASTGGGGSKIMVVARVDPTLGTLIRATFISARLSSTGKINSVSNLVAAGETNTNRLVFGLKAAFSARSINKSSKTCNSTIYYETGPLWNWELSLNKNLTAASYSCAPGCTPLECRPDNVTVTSCVNYFNGTVLNPSGWNWLTRLLL